MVGLLLTLFLALAGIMEMVFDDSDNATTPYSKEKNRPEPEGPA